MKTPYIVLITLAVLSVAAAVFFVMKFDTDYTTGFETQSGHCIGTYPEFGCEAFLTQETCCSNGKCSEGCSWVENQINESPLCQGISCPDLCKGDFMLYNGQCAAGNCIYDSQPCNSADSCDGSIRSFNGRCENNKCVVESEDCSVRAAHCGGSVSYINPTCENGICVFQSAECKKNDYCEGDKRIYFDKCSDGACVYLSEDCSKKINYCQGNVKYYDAGCENGICSYKLQLCEFGCENGECKVDPCAGETCGNGYCNTDCGESLSTCFIDCAECGVNKPTAEASDTKACITEGNEGTQTCTGGMWGACVKNTNYLQYAIYGGCGLIIIIALIMMLRKR
jgi:hypothetical protein